MKLQDPLKQHPPFDVAAGQAQMYLDKGYLEVKSPSTPEKPKQPMKWFVRPGQIAGDYQHPPFLVHSCPECGVRGMTESPKGTAHQTTKVFHCGQRGETCPPAVAMEYQVAYTAWKSRSRKAPVEKISAASPRVNAKGFVAYKSHEELVAEAMAATKNV
jgi:hypothetical protein